MEKESLYHGTRIIHGVNILREGELLSPLYLRMRELEQKIDLQKLQSLGKSLKEYALDLIYEQFIKGMDSYEPESVSLTTEFEKAKGYALQYYNGPGMVFELVTDNLKLNHERGNVYVYEKITLDERLKQIHLWDRKKAHSFSEEDIKKWGDPDIIVTELIPLFDKYKCKFFYNDIELHIN